MKVKKITAIVLTLVLMINIIVSNIVLATENEIEEIKKENINNDAVPEEKKEENDLNNETNIESNNDIKQEEINFEETNKENEIEEVKEKELEEKNEVKKNIENDPMLKREIIEEQTETTNGIENKSKVEYSSHIQNYGWEEEFSKKDGEISGEEAKNNRLEALKIRLGNSEEITENSTIKYKVHAQDYGWMSWKQNGEIAGTIGESKRIEAIRIELENLEEYSVIYRTYVESTGWTDWVNNGEVSGTEGQGLKIEAIQINIVENPIININKVYDQEKNVVVTNISSTKAIKEIKNESGWNFSENRLSCTKEYDVNDKYTVTIKDFDSIEKEIQFEINQIIEPTSIVKYSSHISDFGWEKKYSKIDGDISGLEREDKGIEAIQIALGNSELIPNGASISYQSYVTGMGWQAWASNGEITGTTGQNKSIEAVKITISGMEGYSVEYRVYIEGKGWQKWRKNGEEAGNAGQNIAIQGIQIQIKKAGEETIEPRVEYQAHVQNIGWQNFVGENGIAGTTGRSLGMEALRINANGLGEQVNIKYQAHVQDIGWQNWVSNGAVTGTTGQTKRMEAIKIVLENTNDYSIEYRAHISGYGWQKWRKNGEIAGTTGQARKIEAIQIRIIYKGTETIEPELSYKSHVQNIGWQNYITEGFISGTEGQAKRVEAMQINLTGISSNARVLYRTHVQDIGWQNWTSNNGIAGTTGLGKRIEAIQIKLEGLDQYTVEYKVHIQDYGWSGWMIDGETAGTTGKAKRIEAIQIRMVPKYYRQYYGIDVSSHNGEINWQAVKNSGVQFAMIRCGYRGYRSGAIVQDTKFEYNINNALAVGIKVGIYFFSQAITTEEAIEEANFSVNMARRYNITYPIAIDSESSGAENNDGRADGINPYVRTNVLATFCNQVRNSGYVPMIYASRDWFYNRLQVDRLSNYETWLAHYTGSPNIKSNYKYNYTMWQYTSSGSLSGISGRVDLNVGYKNY